MDSFFCEALYNAVHKKDSKIPNNTEITDFFTQSFLVNVVNETAMVPGLYCATILISENHATLHEAKPGQHFLLCTAKANDNRFSDQYSVLFGKWILY